MRRESLASILVAVLAITLGASSFAQAESPEEMVAAANALDKAFIAAFNSGNAEAVSALYWNSPDAVQMPPDLLIARGIAGIREANIASVKSMVGGKLELTESHQIPFQDVVVGWGLWHFTMPVPEGAPVEMVGRYTDVKAKRDGKWVYIVDHASVSVPPAPMPGASKK